MANKKYSHYNCPFYNGKTIYLSFAEQAKVIMKIKTASSTNSNQDIDKKTFKILSLPIFAPYGVIRCEDCEKIKNVTTAMAALAIKVAP